MYIALGVCALLALYVIHCLFRAHCLQRELTTINSERGVLASMNTVALATAKAAREHWKSYAIALEVLCECCAEGDSTGANNASSVIEYERNILHSLGEYDD